MKLVRTGLPAVPQRDFRVAAIDGVGELLAEPGDPLSPRLIVAHLVRGEPDGWLAQLPVALFDRLCAAIFATEFSSNVECRSDCAACAAPFDFRFDLTDLIAAQDRAAGSLGIEPEDGGYWRIADDLALRPPVLGDLDQGVAPGDLAGRLLRTGDREDPRIDALLEAGAPLLTLPIGTACPHCGEAQEIGFDMASYLVAGIAAERPFLIRETHLLAARYGWSHASIMALPRKDRRAYAALIESERSAALARRSA